MKITAVILLVLCMQVYAKSFGQAEKINLMVNSNFKDAIEQLEKISGYRFVLKYDQSILDKKIDVNYTNERIDHILSDLLKDTGFTYKVIDRYIAIVPLGELNNLNQQQKSVSGNVSDSSGAPLPGVSVVIKGTTSGTITDANGNYSLSNVPANAILQFSFVGMKAQEITVGSKTAINIKLEDETVGLEEVVAVGYGTQKKENLTGSVAQVKMDKLLGSRPVSSLTTAIQGSIPGLQITSSSGRPGQAAAIRIRGIMSINGGNPLVLVDNVPMEIDDLNPTDIETISVLKDASASSIYGGRAAFGVIVITTKKGLRNQPLKFNYSNNFTVSQPTELPEKASTMEMVTALKAFGNTASWTGQDLNTWGNLLTEYKADPTKYPDGETMVNGVRYRLAEDDLYKKFMTNSFEQMHNLSFSGGSEKSSYRVSLGYADEDGIMMTSKDSYEKFNVNAYLNNDLAKNLVSSLNILYKNDNRLTPSNYGALFNQGIGYGLHTDSGYFTNPDGSTLPFNTPNNYLALEPADQTAGQDLRLFEKLEFRPVKGLKITGEYTFKKTITDFVSTRTNNIYENAQTYNAEKINTESSYSRSNGNTEYHALNVYANYDKKIGSHDLKFLVGTNQELSKYSYFSATRLGLISIATPSLSTASGTMSNSESFSDFSISGYFARFNYAYKDKYLFEANSRYDGSSRFPKDGRYGFFPSFSAGWVATEEPFMKSIGHILSFMKLRGSWGEIGNQSVGNYAYIPGMDTRNASWINTSTAIRYLTVAPPLLVSSSFTWETVRTSNFGVDLSFLDKRINATFDYFNRATLNMLGAASDLPAVLGTSAPLQNVANLVSKGWEASLEWKVIKPDFGYSLGINVSDNRGFVTKFDNPAGLLSNYYKDYEFGEIWGYETFGFYTPDDFVPGTLDATLQNGTLKPEIPAFYTSIKTNPGDIRFVDLNTDGKISPGSSTLADPGDRKIIGNNNRRYQFGITGNFFYKNFDLSFFMQGVGKRDLWISNQLYWPYQTTFEAFYKNQLDYWTADNQNAFFPRSYPAAGGNTETSRNVQTKYLSNGAYLRFKNIELGYSLPKSVVERLNIKYTRFFISAENLFTFDHLPKGMDPEIANESRGGGYPFIKKISLGINLSF